MIQGTFSLDSKGVFQQGNLKPHIKKMGSSQEEDSDGWWGARRGWWGAWERDR